MIKYLFPFLFFLTIVNAENVDTYNEELIDDEPSEYIDEVKIEPSVDCLILQDENSIICKFETNRSDKDESIVVQWIDPQGDVSRSRNMLVPAGHASIYDYRYINGRITGEWTFRVIENEKEFATKFQIK
jgi:hypothetical protein